MLQFCTNLWEVIWFVFHVRFVWERCRKIVVDTLVVLDGDDDYDDGDDAVVLFHEFGGGRWFLFRFVLCVARNKTSGSTVLKFNSPPQ